MSGITTWSNYETIAALDPLGFDERAQILPTLNAQGDKEALVDVYDALLSSSFEALATGIDTDNAVASLRDLDFIAGSLARHGAIEVAEQDRAQQVLSSLGKIAGNVPRGTVFTYAACNPDGFRRRTFTGTDGEELFIAAVKKGVSALDVCMDAIAAAGHGKPEHLDEAEMQMGKMVSSIITVKRNITPQFFTFTMRPYFDSLTVDDVTYAGAGGAQMQVTAVDRMVWGADCEDPAYEEYYTDNVRYLTPDQKRTIQDFESSTEGRSLVTLINEGMLSPDAATSTNGLLRVLRKFRYPHRKVANDNFALRPDGSVGSGQYTPIILDRLIELNEDAIRKLEGVTV